MIPNLLWKAKIPEHLPKGLEGMVEKLKKSKGKNACLEKAYNLLSEEYIGCNIYKRFFDVFTSDVNKLWNIKYQHCTNINYLLRILLVKSGFFKDEDISLKLTLICYFSIHQYLKIRLDKDDYVNADLWAAHRGISLGDYAHGFHY